jgi:Periplasmic binding protein
MPTAEIAAGGGFNVFAGLKQTWTSVSWEQVVAADPQCIVINDYGTPTAAQKEQFLETDPITKNLSAVKNHCFLPLSYDCPTTRSRPARVTPRRSPPSPGGCTRVLTGRLATVSDERAVTGESGLSRAAAA